MKKKYIYLLIILAGILFVIYWYRSKSLQPLSTSITGPLGNYYCIVDRKYSIKHDLINVELKCIKKDARKELSKDSPSSRLNFTFIMEIKDKQGNTISKSICNSLDNEDDFEMLESLAVGETSTIPFPAESYGYFKIGSTIKINEQEAESPTLFQDETMGFIDKFLHYAQSVLAIFALL